MPAETAADDAKFRKAHAAFRALPLLRRRGQNQTLARMQPVPSFSDSAAPAPAPAASYTRPISENPVLAALAADLLRTPQALLQLSTDEAMCVVGYMRLVPYAKGTVLFRRGDQASSGFMLLILEGEVSVEAGEIGSTDAVEIAVLGAGSVIGEMSLLDGAPRSATCTAVSIVKAAGLSRRGLEIMIDEHPRVASKLLIGLAQRIGDRLRAMDDQIQIYAQLNATLQQQIEALRAKVRA
jgi:CRP-like cAMP-binding protein